MAYARKKWGRSIAVEDNRIIREPERQLAVASPEQEKDQGFSR
jgi:hypothetical protein